MKKVYTVFVNTTGNPNGSGVQVTVQAESEFEAMQKALRDHPNCKVASIKQKQ